MKIDREAALKLADGLAAALEAALDLMQVPEHLQDTEWYKDEKKLFEILDSYTEKRKLFK